MALVLMALGVAVACAREGIAQTLRPLLPHVGRLAGALLTVSGAYLVYYWARLRFGNGLTLADDPIVGLAARYSSQLESFARQHGTPLVTAAGVIVTLALATGMLRLRRRRPTATGDLARR